MFPDTPLLSCHIKSAVQTPNWLEIIVETEHLKYQVLSQGLIFLAVDCHVGRIVEGNDPMYRALNVFLHHNNPRLLEMLK